MNIIAAIDIKNGKCVRLFQGNFEKETIYADDPVVVARQWEKQGAKKLHVIDLDGARDGKMKNMETIIKIIKAVKIPVQVGGGIRDEKTVAQLIQSGAKKIILGTIALEDAKFLKKILKRNSKKIIVSLDTKFGKLVKNGWRENSKKNIISVIKSLENLGVTEFIYTDTLKDGTLTSPNFEDIEKLLQFVDTPVTIAGGVSSNEDLKKLKQMKIKNVIVGKALYERKIKIC